MTINKKGSSVLVKTLVGSLLLLTTSAQAKQLKSYEDMVHTVEHGNLITITYNNESCITINPDSLPLLKSSVVVRPNFFIISTKKGFMGATATRYLGSVFSLNEGDEPENGTRQEFRFILNNKNQLRIVCEFFDAGTNQRTSKTVITDCELGKGFKVYTAD